MATRRLVTRLVPPRRRDLALAGATVIVIDVLRASTTLATALEHGAAEVLAVAGLDEAREVAAELVTRRRPKPLLAGERGCLKPAGFDLGNSPAEMTPAAVAGRTLVASTTNGTRALLAAGEARVLLLGAFVNLSATADRVVEEDEGDVAIVCAGVDGQAAYDDVAAAGAFVAALAARGDFELDDGSKVALPCAPERMTSAAVFARISRSGPAGRLEALGLGDDVKAASRVDVFGRAVRGAVHGTAVRLSLEGAGARKRSR